MPSYRNALPQLGSSLFVTDGGIETTLIFHEGLDLPHFAAFDLLRRPGGEEALRKYFRSYAELAKKHGVGMILESATWRANPDWAAKMGYSREQLAQANRAAIRLLDEIRRELEPAAAPVVLSGCIGPRGDGYIPGDAMTTTQAEAYHREQIETLAGTNADMVCAITMNYIEEAIGITRAAKAAGMPVAIAFTVETDGALPTGQSLATAIERVDAATSAYPAYYLINCCHPAHFDHALAEGTAWTARIRGLRANASRKSHAELNESAELDVGDPNELGRQYAALKQTLLPRLNVVGGCCGTDERHVERMIAACAPLFPRTP